MSTEGRGSADISRCRAIANQRPISGASDARAEPHVSEGGVSGAVSGAAEEETWGEHDQSADAPSESDDAPSG
jgi:hypothetical protein